MVLPALGADDYLTKPFALQEVVLRLRALDRRRAHHRPPVREIAGLRVDPFRRVYRDGRYVALTRKQFAVLEVLVAPDGGVDHAGAGLGLAIVKSITQGHDGTLNLTRRATGGLRATLQLPAAPPDTGS